MERIVQAISTPTITAGAYSAGKCIGGQLTFKDTVSRGFGAIYSTVILDKAGQNAAMDLVLFSAPLASPPADAATVAITSADLLNVIGVIPFIAGDYASVGTGGVAGKAGKLGLFMGAVGTSDNNIYGVLICRGTPTYVSTSDITVKLFSEIGTL